MLGTDGYGRSDTREQVRRFFEVVRHFVAVAALKALADLGKVPRKKVSEAMRIYGIDPEKPHPVAVWAPRDQDGTECSRGEPASLARRL